MKYASKVAITESVVYEVGQELVGKGIVERIKITYPLARVFVKGNALPVVEAFVQVGSVIDWIPE